MVGINECAFAQDRGPLQDIVQLSNVSGPLILEKYVSCLAGQTSRRPTERRANLLKKRFAQRKDVRRTLAQRWNLDVEDAKSVEQILSKLATFHVLAEIAVGRGDHPDVRLEEPRPAQ